MYWIYHNRSLYKPGQIEKDNAFSHTDQAWLIVRYQNQETPKMVEIDEIQNKIAKFKPELNQVKVFQGDVLKFGRVRFKIREMVTQTQSGLYSPKKSWLQNKFKPTPQKVSKVHNL